MMKWKVVKSPRSASADRSLECLRNDVTLTPLQSNNNNNNTNANNNDSNNNVGEESNNNSPPPKESNRHRESSLSRKPSIITTECINLRSILGLTGQRSETNLSCLGLICNETRRSRSEVRGVSCDRLTVGYHSSPGNPTPNGKTRSSSPPSKTGWLRGRKRERESRNPVKNNQEVFGKTVVTGSSRKRTGSKTQNGDGRTIVDGSDNKHKNKLGPSVKSSLEHRKGKGRKSGDEDIIEEEIYAEIDFESVHCKLLAENGKESLKEPIKVIRKKGLAPKPQIATELFKETNGEAVTVSHNGLKTNGSLNEMHPMPPNRKPPRKNQTFNGRNQDKKSENRAIHSVKLNNLKNAENSLMKAKNNINIQSVVAVAEIHSEVLSMNLNSENTNTVPDPKPPSSNGTDVVPNPLPVCDDVHDHTENDHTGEEALLPFHIDTPDYSTLESANDNSLSLSTEDITLSKEDIINCNTDCDESLQESQNSADNAKVSRELSLSSILRDSTSETIKVEAEPKKTVRFEKLDLIETYKKHKTESCMDTEDDTDISASESQSTPSQSTALDVNSNEIGSLLTTGDTSHSSNTPENGAPDETKNLTVNVVVRHPSPVPQEVHSGEEHSPTPFVVKKSFVLTVAKQEKGFGSLCANKKPEPVLAEHQTTPTPTDPQISVTFLCSASKASAADDRQRLRSTSVPPQGIFPSPEMLTAFPSSRGRSRDGKSKDRQHCKKNHKSRKKDAVFVMPQAVIDELSQVLEKRKPSLDEIRQLHP